MGIDARMYVITKKKLTDKEVLRLSYEVGEAFGSERFGRLEKPMTDSKGVVFVNAHHNIERIDEGRVSQDGPDYVVPRGHTLYEVHLWTRYYGPGYERGDLPFIIALAEWLERKFGHDAQIMYGGDSSGVLGEPFGPEERKKMLDHFASPKGRAYFAERSLDGRIQPPICQLCQEPLVQYGYGPGPSAGTFTCYGCGVNLHTTDGGKTWTPKERERF